MDDGEPQYIYIQDSKQLKPIINQLSRLAKGTIDLVKFRII